MKYEIRYGIADLDFFEIIESDSLAEAKLIALEKLQDLVSLNGFYTAEEIWDYETDEE